jgi:septin family protein
MISFEDAMFKHPFCMTVAGPSQSGKTQFVYNVLKNTHNLIHPLPNNILYCYSNWQPIFNELKQDIKNIEFLPGVPEMDTIDNCLVILDDLMADCIDNKEVFNLFTVGSHHRNASVIFLTQNIFEQGKYARSISLNSHYLVIFNNRRDQSQIMHVGRQLYPGNSKFFNEVFDDAVKVQSHGYLIIDLMPQSNESIRLRTYNFNSNEVYVYIKK